MSLRKTDIEKYERVVEGVYDALRDVSYAESAEVLRDCLLVTDYVLAATGKPENLIDFLLDRVKAT